MRIIKILIRLLTMRACLVALEAGKKSDATAAFQQIQFGKEGFQDWWPKAVSPLETDEHAWAVFEALVERWHRLMTGLPTWR